MALIAHDNKFNLINDKLLLRFLDSQISIIMLPIQTFLTLISKNSNSMLHKNINYWYKKLTIKNASQLLFQQKCIYMSTLKQRRLNQKYYTKNTTWTNLLAVSSPTRSMLLLLSALASGFPDNRNEGWFCCHEGLLRFDGSVGRKLTGLLVPLPRLPPWGPGTWRKHNMIRQRHSIFYTVKLRYYHWLWLLSLMFTKKVVIDFEKWVKMWANLHNCNFRKLTSSIIIFVVSLTILYVLKNTKQIF